VGDELKDNCTDGQEKRIGGTDNTQIILFRNPECKRQIGGPSVRRNVRDFVKNWT